MTIIEGTSIVVAICALIGTIISYFALKSNCKKEINTVNTIISTINKGQSQGSNYTNCNFYSDVHDKNSIKNDFQNE